MVETESVDGAEQSDSSFAECRDSQTIEMHVFESVESHTAFFSDNRRPLTDRTGNVREQYTDFRCPLANQAVENKYLYSKQVLLCFCQVLLISCLSQQKIYLIFRWKIYFLSRLTPVPAQYTNNVSFSCFLRKNLQNNEKTKPTIKIFNTDN